MSIFEPSTPATESPETGHEEVAAEEQQETLESQDPVDETEAGEDVQAEETQEETPSSEEETEEEEHGELLAGKYKTVDDLVKAYKNLEREFHKSRQEKTKTQTQAPPEGYGEQQDPYEVFWNAFQQDPLGTIDYLVSQRMQQQVAPLYEQQANEVLLRNLGDLSQEYQEVNTEEGISNLFAKVNEIAEELGNPSLAQNPPKRLLNMAASEAFGDSKAKLYKRAKEEGREEVYKNIRSKQGLSAPSGTKPKEKPKSIEEQIAESIVNAGRGGGIFG